jgi:nicotinamidase-related amidase
MQSYNTALILIGYQKDYFDPQGILYQAIEQSSSANQVIANTVNLLQSIDPTQILTIATPITFTPTYEELIEPIGILKTIKDVGAFQAGSTGSEMITALHPFRHKILEIAGKKGFNAFLNTNLDTILQQHGITQIILAGAIASICIDSTGRYAHEHGYQVTVLEDCISGRTIFEHQFYCESIFPLYAEVNQSKNIMRNIKNTKALQHQNQ